MMRWLQGGLLFALMLAAPALAAPSSQSDAVKALILASSDRDDFYSKEGRVALVSAIGDYCEALDAVVPRNRPSENEWLEGEIAAGGDRAMAALSSKEFGRRRMLEFTENCGVIARSYIGGHNQQLNLFNMLYFWARFVPGADQYGAVTSVSGYEWGFPFLNSVIEALALSGAITASEGIARP